MDWFTDVAEVSFGGIDKIFDVSSVFCDFSIGTHNITINWYGVIIAFGFTHAALFGGRIAYTWRINLSKMLDVLLYGTVGGVIGARLISSHSSGAITVLIPNRFLQYGMVVLPFTVVL